MKSQPNLNVVSQPKPEIEAASSPGASGSRDDNASSVCVKVKAEQDKTTPNLYN